MFGFIKKLFGFGSADQTTDNAAQAPYKVEDAVAKVKAVADVNKDGKVNLDDAKAAVEKVAVTLRQPGAPKQGQRKPATRKPQGQKPAAPKKPAQGTAPKQGGNKPRGRKPKAKPAA